MDVASLSGVTRAIPAGALQISDDPPTVPQVVVSSEESRAAARFSEETFSPDLLPGLFATEMVRQVPAAAWSQVPEADGGAPAPIFAGWTGIQPVVPEGGSGMIAPERVRRRRAWLAVLTVAAVTVLVLVTALIVAPRWSGATDADKTAPNSLESTVTATTTAPTTTAPTTSVPTSITSTALPSRPAGVAPHQSPNARTTARPVTRTVTVTQGAPAKPVAGPTGADAYPGARSSSSVSVGVSTSTSVGSGFSFTSSASASPPASSPSGSALPSGSGSVSVSASPNPVGVPVKQIACGAGYIVQLASAPDLASFQRQVALLKSQGKLSAGAMAADVHTSCRIFHRQRNSLVLYSGPYAQPYDGCAARLTGPADAFIRSQSPVGAAEFVSCICPARAAEMPDVTSVGQVDVWIGELQRMLGDHLNVPIRDLDGHWGVFTSGTQNAVKEEQAALHLPVTGTVNGPFWVALQKVGC